MTTLPGSHLHMTSFTFLQGIILLCRCRHIVAILSYPTASVGCHYITIYDGRKLMRLAIIWRYVAVLNGLRRTDRLTKRLRVIA